ncbi:MAG: hypothetical protein K8I02_11785, partial [Candidatus Methylomirabilis sp.]|nr:hypothetical protein [Deltaproteobacteria bacterium]
NSGSAVFNAPSVAAGAPFVEGILVRGEQDFVFQDTCFKSNVCTDLGCSGEDVTRAKEIEGAIPNSGAMILAALFDFGGASAALDLGGAPGTNVGDAVLGLRDAAGL